MGDPDLVSWGARVRRGVRNRNLRAIVVRGIEGRGGGGTNRRQRAESRRIVAARPLCAYNTRRVFKSSAKDSTRRSMGIALQGGPRGSSPRGGQPATRALGGEGPLRDTALSFNEMCHDQTPRQCLRRIGPPASLGSQRGALPASDSRNKSRSRSVPPATPTLSPREAAQSDFAKRPSGLGPGPRAQPRANPFPEVTDPFCRLPLPTLFHRQRLFTLETDAVMSTAGRGRHSVLGFSSGGCRTPRGVRCSSGRWTLPPVSRFEWAAVKKKDNSSRGPARRLGLPNVAVGRRVGSGILTRFPFEPVAEHAVCRASPTLGSTNPCASAVHMEPFPSSAFKVLI
ncbi:hypothetical protein DH2020_003935 [Rehmannia glutinosa]|uniref:Uncharacterized protein n=1 Tax=Rehmannia glutinosa TaxID=99300 RepID=A0ABR0XN97_REHGL